MNFNNNNKHWGTNNNNKQRRTYKNNNNNDNNNRLRRTNNNNNTSSLTTMSTTILSLPVKNSISPSESSSSDLSITNQVSSFVGPPASSISRPQITDHPIFEQMRSLPGVSEDAAFRATLVYLDLFESECQLSRILRVTLLGTSCIHGNFSYVQSGRSNVAFRLNYRQNPASLNDRRTDRRTSRPTNRQSE